MHLATAQAVAARPSGQPDPRETCMEPRKIIPDRVPGEGDGGNDEKKTRALRFDRVVV
jgi:hypothetical protein